MAKWNKGKADPSKINGGNQFTSDDILAVDELNAMVNNSFYAVDFAEANTLSIGSVSSGETASATITGIAPNKVLNLVLPKGDKGDKGDVGDAGNLDTELSATSTNGVQNKVISAKITELEDRLTSLGFKQGSIEWNGTAPSYINTNSSSVIFKRQGNYVIAEIQLVFLNNANVYYFFNNPETKTLGVIPEQFRALNDSVSAIGVPVSLQISYAGGEEYTEITRYTEVRLIITNYGALRIENHNAGDEMSLIHSSVNYVGASEKYTIGYETNRKD